MKYNDLVKLLYPLSNVKLADSAINTVAERAQRASNRKNTCKLRKHFRQFDNAHAVKAHNTHKKRAANKMYVVVLRAFAVCFFICLCCEHLPCVSLFVCVVSICTICCQNYEDVFLICWCFFYLHVFSEVAAR